MAGESARDVAQRQRAKAERLTRSAALWERGAEGEAAVAAALAQLPTETWNVFHDVRWPGRRYANVDHIVVGPAGVFVVDAKNWSGRVTARDDVLRQNGFSRERDVAGAAEAGLAVAGLVPLLKPQHVHPVLCFVRDEELSGWARDVMVCSTSNVVRMLTSRPEVLAEHQVNELRLELDLGLRDAGIPGPAVASAARAEARRTTTGTSRRRSRWSGLAKPVVGLALAAVLIMRPDLVTGLGDVVAGFIVDEASTDTPDPEPKKEQRHKPADGKRGATQGR
ncbi:MAG: nuclease-related domain-containing protein [Nocardioides sp.]